MLPYIDVLNQLEHTRYHSGQDLAKLFGVTRATIHNCILRIIAMGIAVDRVRGKGYKLLAPLDLLDAALIKSQLTSSVKKGLTQLEILHEVDSTNRYINDYSLPEAKHFSVVLAEMQSAGKGRRGREWVSPYGANIYMSVLWPLQKSLSEVGGLSPLLSMCLLHALQGMGVTGLGLKWPNDIYCHNKKLAGLLIECSGEVNGASKMVIGIGVNVRMSQQANIKIDQAWTDIISHTSNKAITRNEIAAQLLNHLYDALCEFDSAHIDDIATQWAKWDILKDKPVILHTLKEDIHGIARGIDAHGYLLLETNNTLQRISAGDVSLRAE